MKPPQVADTETMPGGNTPETWITRITGWLPALIGAFSLAAWFSGWAENWSGEGVIVVKTNMALCQMASGVALLLLGLPSSSRLRRAAGMALASFVLLIGGLTLAEHLFQYDLGIDQLLAAELPGATATASPNRMGPPGSASLLLVGSGLLTLAYRRRTIAPWFGLAVGLVNIVPAVGFLYGIAGFYSRPRLTGIAWPSVVGLMSLGIGLMLARLSRGPVNLLFRRDAGGAVLRRMLPAVLLIPLVLGYFRVHGQVYGLYDDPTGTGLLVIALILGFTAILWRGAALLSHSAAVEAGAQQAVRQSEKRFRALVTASSEVVYRMSPDWSEMRELHGRDLLPDTVDPNRTWLQKYIHPEDQPRVTEAINQAIRSKCVFELEHRVVRVDRSLAWTFSRAIPLLDENGEIVEWFGAASDITRGKQAEAALRETNALLEQKVQERTAELAKRAHQLRALGGKLRQSEQSERRRLAKVLHDHLQQILVGAKFRVAILGRTGDDLVRQAAEEVENLLDESIGASRSLTAQLSPPVLHDAGLSTSLEWLARWMADRHGLIVDLQVEGHLPRLAVDLNTLLFESTRELLFNAVKHARVHAATVDIRMVENDMLQVTVSDEGKGFDPARIAAAGEPEGGFGLFAIREQLDLFGGQMEIDSAPGRGSRFILRVPTAAHAAREEPVAELLEHAGEGRTDAAHPPGTGVRIRILLADDHTVMREGLVQLLGLEPDFLIVGEAADGQETLDLTDKLLPDVILMDLNMPKLSGLDATRIIHSRHPGIRILGLSMFEGAERAQDMLSAGAVGYLVKSGPSSDLIAAIRASMSAGAEPDRTAGEASGKSIARQQGSGFDPQR